MSEHGHIKFWQEIGRRNVLRVAAVYIGFSWAVVHSGVVVGEALELPHWIMRFVSALLIVGFPAVVAFAWVYEITPEGLKRADDVERDKSITHRTAQRLNVVIIALILMLAGLYGADRFLLKHESGESAVHAAGEGAPKSPAAEVGVSIAVLPFVNLSGDPGQEFFSDGMTEEITSALAKIKGLKVVGRTSAFEFKGQNKDLRTIGRALGAGYILEGSVRKEGAQIRVTGQLIKVDDGTHIWTEDYDRELKGVFVIQDDISRAIAAALRVPLGLNADEMLAASRDITPEDYQQYLRARAAYRARSVDEAIATLESLVARTPNYAPAWILLVRSYGLANATDPVSRSGSVEEARQHLQLSLDKTAAALREFRRLDPKALGVNIVFRSRTPQGLTDWVATEDRYRQALASDPGDAETLDYFGRLLAEVGRLKEALRVREQLRVLEPFVPVFNVMTADMVLASGRREAAIAILEPISSTEGTVAYNRNVYLARAYAEQGRYGDAANTLLSTPEKSQVFRQSIEDAARVLRSIPVKPAAVDSLPKLDGELSFVYGYAGAASRMMDAPEREMEVQGRQARLWVQLWSPGYASVRKTERFKALVRKLGLVDYWRARGWPDACRPISGDDFECS